jgi:hypothetical protein
MKPILKYIKFDPNRYVEGWKLEAGSRKRIDIDKLVKLWDWKVEDYYYKIELKSVDAIESICWDLLSQIKKNLSGSRQGNVYKIKLSDNKNYILHTASAQDEYPAVLTGRLRASISFADNITKKIRKEDKTTATKTQYRGRSKTVTYEEVMGFYNVDEANMPDDFVDVPDAPDGKVLFVIGSGVPYAQDLELGIATQGENSPPPRPFLRRTFQENFDRIYRDYVKNMKV